MAEVIYKVTPSGRGDISSGLSNLLTKVVFKEEVKISQIRMSLAKNNAVSGSVTIYPRIFTENGTKLFADQPGAVVTNPFSTVIWHSANIPVTTLQPGVIYFIGFYVESRGGSTVVSDYFNSQPNNFPNATTYTGVKSSGDTVNGEINNGFAFGITYTANTAPTTPGAFTQPVGTLNGGSVITVAWGASTDADGNAITYNPEYRYYKNGVAQAWMAMVNTASLTGTLTLPTDKTMDKVEFQVRAFDGTVSSAYRISSIFTIKHNTAPTITLNTPNNETLYENDMFKIDGSTNEPDVGDIVNVYYRLIGGLSRAIATGISTGASIPFNEQLTFKAGKLHKGETAITDALAEGPAHRLEVWSEDNQGGKSTIVERTFYVVPNRAPALTVDAFTDQSGMINNDTIKISGTSSDPDGNDVTVKYRVNEQAAVQIHSGVAGPWSFDLSLRGLKDGENIIVLEVIDTYNFKSSRTIKLNKTANLTPLEHSVQRYKIVPPSGSAQGVLLWIQRDVNQAIEAEISMTTGSEQEQFVPMELKNSAPIDSATIEDDFRYQANELKENIVLKLTWSGDKPISLISGVLV